MKLANRAVWARADDEPGLRGMGTTMTALSLVPSEDEDGDDLLLVVNVGDSRTYLLRDGELTQVTEDHSLVEDLVREGRITEAEARIHPQRNILTRVLGNEPDVEVDEFPVIPVAGDRYLLCSDGLFNEVEDDRIAAVLRRIADPGEAARELVRLANEGGGRDNITVVVVDVVDDDDAGARASAVLAANGAPALRHPPGTAPAVEPDEQGPTARRPPPSRSRPPEATLRAPRRLTWRSTLFVVAVLAVVGGAAGAVWWFSTSTYYVGVDGDRVAIFRGRPGGVLWIDPTLEVRTDLAVADVPPSRLDAVQAGQEEPSLEAAERYVANLEDEARAIAPLAPTHDHDDLQHHDHRHRRDDHRPRHRDRWAGGRRVPVIEAIRRRTELGLVLLAGIITASAYVLASLGRTRQHPGRHRPFLGVVLGLMLAAHLATRRLARGADGLLLPLAGLLNGIGYVFIARLDEDLAGLQAVWTAVGVAAYVGTLVVVRRTRDLERYRYTFMLVGVGLLLLPLLPGIGRNINGARIWVSLGPLNFQPGEFAKIVLAVFFASYLVEKREVLGLAAIRIGPVALPDLRTSGPSCWRGARRCW